MCVQTHILSTILTMEPKPFLNWVTGCQHERNCRLKGERETFGMLSGGKGIERERKRERQMSEWDYMISVWRYFINPPVWDQDSSCWLLSQASGVLFSTKASFTLKVLMPNSDLVPISVFWQPLYGYIYTSRCKWCRSNFKWPWKLMNFVLIPRNIECVLNKTWTLTTSSPK